MCNRSVVLLVTSFVLSLFAATPALAAPPVNDNRESAVTLSLPQSVTGSTVEATLEDGEPSDYQCDGSSKGSVWYRLSGVSGRIALTLQADGDLDATVTVFTRVRSQTESLDCGNTDGNGLGIAAFTASAGKEYIIRVSERHSSVSGTFTLKTLRAQNDAEAPGRHLPAKGHADTINFATNPSDAWSTKMRSGVTYRVNLATNDEGYCVRARIERGGDTVKRLNCHSGYTLITPRAGEGGRYTIFVETSSRRLSNQRYRLQVARAGSDDTGPGRFWPGNTKGGHLSGGGIDVSDLYNWDLDRRAIVELSVSGGFDLLLLSPKGRVLARGGNGESIERRMSAGQYFVVVRTTNEDSGSYKLRRVVRTITSTSVAFNGARDAVASSGQGIRVTGTVSPASSGRIELTIERFDPVFGWQFFRNTTGNASGGSYSTSFTAPGVGRWRAKAAFKGSRTANRSKSGYARLKVVR